MTILIPKKWDYTVTDADGNFIRTIHSKHWKRNNCRLIIRTFSDSDKTDISINVDSDFAISIPVVADLSEPRRFNIEPLKLTLTNQSFDSLYEVHDFTADVDLAAEAMKEFQEILDFLDYLDQEREKRRSQDTAESSNAKPNTDSTNATEIKYPDAPPAPFYDAKDVEDGLEYCLDTGSYPNGRPLSDDGKNAISSILNLKDNLKQDYLDNHLCYGYRFKNKPPASFSEDFENKTALDIAITVAINDMIFALNNN